MIDMSDPTTVAASVAVTGALIGGALFVGRMWKPFRGFVAFVDILKGRPPRYKGDPEARPGLIQHIDETNRKLTCISESLSQVSSTMSALNSRVSHIEDKTSDMEKTMRRRK